VAGKWWASHPSCFTDGEKAIDTRRIGHETIVNESDSNVYLYLYVRQDHFRQESRVLLHLRVRRVKEERCVGFDHFEFYERRETETKKDSNRNTHTCYMHKKWFTMDCNTKLKPKISTLIDGTAQLLFKFRGVDTNHRTYCTLWDRLAASFCSDAVTRAYTSRYVWRMQAMQVSTLCQAGHPLPNMFQVLFKPNNNYKEPSTIPYGSIPMLMKSSQHKTPGTLNFNVGITLLPKK
jgi:hypothetical protein